MPTERRKAVCAGGLLSTTHNLWALAEREFCVMTHADKASVRAGGGGWGGRKSIFTGKSQGKKNNILAFKRMSLLVRLQSQNHKWEKQFGLKGIRPTPFLRKS